MSLNFNLSSVPTTQSEDFWHEDFDSEVQQVAFEVGGKGFIVDATRLAKQSAMLNEMFQGSALGEAGEGTTANPIKVPDCTVERFAHFLKWFNHAPWEDLGIPVVEGNIDILHMSRLFIIPEGVKYAVAQLETANLDAATRLHLARKYIISEWLDQAIRDLLSLPLSTLVLHHLPAIGLTTFSSIACAKEAISDNRKKASICIPYATDFDDAPYCSNRERCKEVWFTVWVREICRLLHDTRRHTPLANLRTYFDTLPFVGMHVECKEHVLNSLPVTNLGIAREEELIVRAIAEISAL